jgi:hypothetical protein
MICFRLPVLLVALAGAPALAADTPRSVPDTPANLSLSGDQYWTVISVRADGEAAIGLARDQIGENPKVQVARTRDGKYAVLVGPEPKQTDEELKSRFSVGRGPALESVRQSQGEEFVARAWQNADARLAAGEMEGGKAFSLKTGTLALSLRVEELKKKKKDDAEYVIAAEGREDGKVAFTLRTEALYSPEPVVKASFVKLDGASPQAVISHYTGGAHCCLRTTIAAKGEAGNWTLLRAGTLDGDYGYAFEDLDGDGTFEMLSGDNRFLYQFDSYAASRMPAKIEKVIGGKIVDVTRRPEYRRYHVQYLAALEADADEETWKQGGFLAGWTAQKVLLGEGGEAFARATKSYDPGGGMPFEECTLSRPIDKCPEKNKKQVPFAEALRKFLDRNGYK